MASVGDLLLTLETVAPVRWAFDFDNVGLLFGSRETEITGIVVALDPTMELIDRAIAAGANVLITHHPVLFNGTKKINDSTFDGRFLLSLAKHGLVHIVMHTNWDAAPGGINDALAIRLGLENLQAFGMGAEVSYSNVVVLAPVEEAETVIDAMSVAGAGHIGHYRRCAFKGVGVGTYFPETGANPAIGRIGVTVELDETRIEMIVQSRNVERVIAAIRASHSYEEPAFSIIPLRPLVEQPCGRIGEFPRGLTASQLRDLCTEKLGCPAWLWGESNKLIKKVAVCGGAADDTWQAARAAGADAFISGEIKHHNGMEASQAGMSMIAAGHKATEEPGMQALKELLGTLLPEVPSEFVAQ